jgi:hypothetical protein
VLGDGAFLVSQFFMAALCDAEFSSPFDKEDVDTWGATTEAVAAAPKAVAANAGFAEDPKPEEKLEEPDGAGLGAAVWVTGTGTGAVGSAVAGFAGELNPEEKLLDLDGATEALGGIGLGLGLEIGL